MRMVNRKKKRRRKFAQLLLLCFSTFADYHRSTCPQSSYQSIFSRPASRASHSQRTFRSNASITTRKIYNLRNLKLFLYLRRRYTDFIRWPFRIRANNIKGSNAHNDARRFVLCIATSHKRKVCGETHRAREDGWGGESDCVDCSATTRVVQRTGFAKRERATFFSSSSEYDIREEGSSHSSEASHWLDNAWTSSAWLSWS